MDEGRVGKPKHSLFPQGSLFSDQMTYGVSPLTMPPAHGGPWARTGVTGSGTPPPLPPSRSQIKPGWVPTPEFPTRVAPTPVSRSNRGGFPPPRLPPPRRPPRYPSGGMRPGQSKRDPAPPGYRQRGPGVPSTLVLGGAPPESLTCPGLVLSGPLHNGARESGRPSGSLPATAAVRRLSDSKVRRAPRHASKRGAPGRKDSRGLGTRSKSIPCASPDMLQWNGQCNAPPDTGCPGMRGPSPGLAD